MLLKSAAGLMASLLTLSPAPVSAQDPIAVSDDDLAEARGGFLTAAGVTLDFGAVVRTYIDGRLALESRLTWSPTGAITQQTVGDVPGSVDLAVSLDQALAAGLDLDALTSPEGVLLSNEAGATALVQQFRGGVQNLLINNADGRELRQDIEINLTLPQLDVMQRDYGVERLGAAISQDITAGLLSSLRP